MSALTETCGISRKHLWDMALLEDLVDRHLHKYWNGAKLGALYVQNNSTVLSVLRQRKFRKEWHFCCGEESWLTISWEMGLFTAMVVSTDGNGCCNSVRHLTHHLLLVAWGRKSHHVFLQDGFSTSVIWRVWWWCWCKWNVLNGCWINGADDLLLVNKVVLFVSFRRHMIYIICWWHSASNLFREIVNDTNVCIVYAHRKWGCNEGCMLIFNNDVTVCCLGRKPNFDHFLQRFRG